MRRDEDIDGVIKHVVLAIEGRQRHVRRGIPDVLVQSIPKETGPAADVPGGTPEPGLEPRHGQVVRMVRAERVEDVPRILMSTAVEIRLDKPRAVRQRHR